MRDVELWEAVALSLNFDPDRLPVYLGAYDRFGDDPFRICPLPFQERLQVSNSNAGTRFPLKVVHRLKARCLVDLPDFGLWASAVWADLPKQFPIGTTAPASPGVKAAPGAGFPETEVAAASWSVKRPERFPGYRRQLFEALRAAHRAGDPCPTTEDIREAWQAKLPVGIVEVMIDGIKFVDSNGETQEASNSAIKKAIDNLVVRPAAQ